MMPKRRGHRVGHHVLMVVVGGAGMCGRQPMAGHACAADHDHEYMVPGPRNATRRSGKGIPEIRFRFPGGTADKEIIDLPGGWDTMCPISG